jgi:tRNA-dihydrouridine synthase
MQFYFAPMEGVTGYIYRNIHHCFFSGIDKYFTPFVVANQTYKFKTREKKDIAVENNRGLYVVPQIMSNKAPEFLWAAQELIERGYTEINLNLGCPAATVVNKKKGSGFLAYPEELDAFLNEIFQGLKNQTVKLSVKTRLGKEEPEEFKHLLKIYHQYPISELIVHPRVQKDFYKNKPNWQAFKEILTESTIPVCYNGNLFSKEDYAGFTQTFPQVESVMLGRGLIANPALLREIQGGQAMKKEELFAFQQAVYDAYFETDLSDNNTLFKMKELWAYMGELFTDGERYIKKIRKAKNRKEYEAALHALFSECELTECYNS